MRVLVTGGAVFIGSHVVDRLVAGGHEVSAVDDLSTGRAANLAQARRVRRVPLHEVDIRSRSLGRVFREVRPEVVMHLAAQLDVRVSVKDPIFDADVNILGTLNVLERARAAGVRKVIVASSGGCIYGEPRTIPTPESGRGRPASPYGISKRVLHDYLAFFKEVHGLDYTVLALSNVYGPRQDPFGEAGVVAIFLGAMLMGRDTVIYGDGRQTRDFVFVSDVADAFVRAAAAGSRPGSGSGSGRVLNIGTGRETSVRALWRACAAVTGFRGGPRFAPARPGELERSAVDPGLARRVLGWSAKASLRAGLRSTAASIAG